MMKATLLPLVAAVALGVGASGPGRLVPETTAAQPVKPDADPRAKDAEPLPEYPKADPKSNVVRLDPAKTFFMEVLPDGRGRRVAFVSEVCLREGPLEVFLCKKGTKEHEAVLRVDLDAKLIH